VNHSEGILRPGHNQVLRRQDRGTDRIENEHPADLPWRPVDPGLIGTSAHCSGEVVTVEVDRLRCHSPMVTVRVEVSPALSAAT
jgi:hypothetical protein